MGVSHSKNAYKEAAQLLAPDEVLILRKLFTDLASRSEDDVIDKQTFLKLIPLPGILGERLFSVVDQSQSGTIDLEEFLCCVAILAKGKHEIRMKLLYEIYNLENHKSGICTSEFVTMMNSVFSELSDDHSQQPTNNNKNQSNEQKKKEQHPQQHHITEEEVEEMSDSEVQKIMKQIDEEIDEEMHSVEHKRLVELFRSKHVLETHIAALGEEALEEYRRTGETTLEHIENFAKDIVSECDEDKSGRLSYEQFKKGVQKYPIILDSVFCHPAVLALKEKLLKSPVLDRQRLFVSQTPNEPSYESNSTAIIHGFLHRPGNLFQGLIKKYYVVSEGYIYEYKSEQAFNSEHPKPSNVLFISGSQIVIPDQSNLMTLITRRIEKIDKTLREQEAEMSPFELQELIEERKNLVTKEKTIHDHEESRPGSPPPLELGELMEDLEHDQEKKPKPALLTRALSKISEHFSQSRDDISSASFHVKTSASSEFHPRSNISSPRISPTLRPLDHSIDIVPAPKLDTPLSPKLVAKRSTSSDEHDHEKFEFQIVLPHKTISFFVDSEQKRAIWVEALEKASKTRKVTDYYHILYEEKLGVGCFANVYACEEINTGNKFAVKVVDKTELTDSEKDTLLTEISCMNLLHHPNIVSKKDVFETSETVYIVMELLTGGTILERIEKRGKFSPERAKSVTEQILEGVKYIHNAGILHRDLKPSNIVFVSESENANIKILDFGLSTFSRPNQMFNKPVGTVKYFAPELIKESQYNSSVDMWCIGVILYNMLVGVFPFIVDTDEELLDAIENAR